MHISRVCSQKFSGLKVKFPHNSRISLVKFLLFVKLPFATHPLILIQLRHAPRSTHLHGVDDRLAKAAGDGSSNEPLQDGQVLVRALDELLGLFVSHELECTLGGDLEDVDAVAAPHAPCTALPDHLPDAPADTRVPRTVHLYTATHSLQIW